MADPTSIECPECGLKLAGSLVLDLHLERVHGDTPEQQAKQSARDWTSFVSTRLQSRARPEIRGGKLTSPIVQELVEHGYEEEEAKKLVRDTQEQMRKEGRAKAWRDAQDDFVLGSIVLIGGGVITAGIYLGGGSEGIVMWPALIYGGYRIIRGLKKL